MDNSKLIRKWSDLYGLAVITGGKKVGTVDDFYLEPGTNAIRALRINTGVYGYRLLQSSTINTLEQQAITIANEYMLAEEKTDGRLPALLPGKQILSYKVMSEGGTVVGKVGNVLIDTSIPVVLRVVAFELSVDSHSRSGQRNRIFAASEVTGYARDAVIILDRVAKR
jgi:sporulation protein YlmC with PRC-barrel domain